MESDRFDTLTTWLASPRSRRRVGLLGLLGLTGGLGLGALPATDEVAARKHKKKRNRRKGKGKGKGGPTCLGCTSCETCVNGACQPLADGATCGAGGICTNDVCARSCTSGGSQCPAGTVCPLESTVCVTGYDCDAPCDTDADCGIGRVCMVTGNCAFLGAKRCGTIAAV